MEHEHPRLVRNDLSRNRGQGRCRMLRVQGRGDRLRGPPSPEHGGRPGFPCFQLDDEDNVVGEGMGPPDDRRDNRLSEGAEDLSLPPSTTRGSGDQVSLRPDIDHRIRGGSGPLRPGFRLLHDLRWYNDGEVPGGHLVRRIQPDRLRQHHREDGGGSSTLSP